MFLCKKMRAAARFCCARFSGLSSSARTRLWALPVSVGLTVAAVSAGQSAQPVVAAVAGVVAAPFWVVAAKPAWKDHVKQAVLTSGAVASRCAGAAILISVGAIETAVVQGARLGFRLVMVGTAASVSVASMWGAVKIAPAVMSESSLVGAGFVAAAALACVAVGCLAGKGAVSAFQGDGLFEKNEYPFRRALLEEFGRFTRIVGTAREGISADIRGFRAKMSRNVSEQHSL